MSNNNISFSLKVKEEIISKKFNECCKKNLLSAIIKNKARITENKIIIELFSTNLYNSFQSLVYSLFDVVINTKILKTTYLVEINDAFNMINQLYINKSSKYLFEETNDEHCKRAYIAGIFIGSGSINSPITSNYHLELKFKKNKIEADNFLKLLNSFDFEFKTIIRNNNIVHYLKKSNLISDFLKLIDAPNSVFNFENERIERDFINNINRLNNIDIYNLQKSLKASEDQIKIINFLMDNNILKNLDDKIVKLSELRLKNPEFSLEELSNFMYKNYEIKISKGGVNHLFRKLRKIYLKKLNN